MQGATVLPDSLAHLLPLLLVMAGPAHPIDGLWGFCHHSPTASRHTLLIQTMDEQMHSTGHRDFIPEV